MQMLPAVPAPRLDALVQLVVDHGVDAEHARPAAPGFHRLQGGHRAAEEAAVLGLPPGVDDRRLAFADDLVIPAPGLRFDRLADRGHVLEVVVVLGGLVGPELAQHPDCGRRGVEDVQAHPLRAPPCTAEVGRGSGSFSRPSRSAIRQGRPGSGYVGTPSYIPLVAPSASGPYTM